MMAIAVWIMSKENKVMSTLSYKPHDFLQQVRIITNCSIANTGDCDHDVTRSGCYH